MGKPGFLDPVKTDNVTGFVVGHPLCGRSNSVFVYRNGGDFVYPTEKLATGAFHMLKTDSPNEDWKVYRIHNLDVYEVS